MSEERQRKWQGKSIIVKSRKALVYRTALSCTGALLLAAAAGARDQAPSASIKLDPAKTTVSFTAGTLRHVHGTFALKGGVFAVDSKSGVAQGEILVDADSEKSNDAGLDKKIQGDTLETGKYPGIFFHPEKVTGSLPAHDGEQHLKLEGSLNIHGQDHPMIVDVDAVKNGEDYFFKTTFDVPYVKWGMKDASTFFMRDRNVRITVESHGTVEEAVKGS